MASKRIVKSALDWNALGSRVPAPQKPNFLTFKSKSDMYLRAVLANPENPPKIDWAYYKKLIPIAGLVDKFQKQYEGLTVPYPADTYSDKVEAQAKETKAEIEKFKKDSNARIAGLKKDIQYLESVLPYDQMTMEDYRDAFPELSLDPINRPTFWPHEPEDQLGHKEAGEATPSH